MDQSQQERSRSRVGTFGVVIAASGLFLCGAICVSGCGSDQGEGMVQNATDPTKSQDAQDSMKSYMKSMQTKGMKPGLKSATPAK